MSEEGVLIGGTPDTLVNLDVDFFWMRWSSKVPDIVLCRVA